MGQCPAGKTGAITARDERHPRRVAQPDDGLHFRGILRQDDRTRDGTQMRQPVRLVRQKIRRLADEAASADCTCELALEGGVDQGMILSPVGAAGGIAGLMMRKTRPPE